MRKDTQGIMKKTKYAIALAALGVLSLGVMGCGKKETSTEATTETTTTEATTEAPQLTVPEGATVISLNDLLTGVTTMTADGTVVPAEEVPETAAEATEEGTTAEVPAEDTTAEAPAEDAAADTTVPAEELVPAESTTAAA